MSLLFSRRSLYLSICIPLLVLYFFFQPTSTFSSFSVNVPSEDLFRYKHLPPELSQQFPSPSPLRKNYHEWNAQTLRELYMCMARNDCGHNQQKVALLAAHWFEEAIVRGWRGGEGVWYVLCHSKQYAFSLKPTLAGGFLW